MWTNVGANPNQFFRFTGRVAIPDLTCQPNPNQPKCLCFGACQPDSYPYQWNFLSTLKYWALMKFSFYQNKNNIIWIDTGDPMHGIYIAEANLFQDVRTILELLPLHVIHVIQICFKLDWWYLTEDYEKTFSLRLEP